MRAGAAMVTLCLAASVHAEGMICPSTASFAHGETRYSLKEPGHDRSYFVHVPRNLRETKPLPVVIVLHGGYGQGADIQKMSQMDKVADANGFLAIYPDGLSRSWNAGGCCGPSMEKNIDDVGFIRDMIDDIGKHYCVDRRRVYATGFSNGSMLAHRLACELSDRIAAVATVSGVIMLEKCQPQRPMSVLVVHGTADPRSLWEGGIGDKNPKKGARDSIAKTMSTLYTRYGCGAETATLFQKGAATCSVARGCDGGNEVGLCKIEGGGHQWPGGEPVWERKLGPINLDMPASAVIWDFFKRHPLPADDKVR